MGLPKSVSVTLLVLVVLCTVVAISVLVGVLYTATHPFREQQAPMTDPAALWMSANCPELPLSHFIAVKEECTVLYYTGELVKTKLINIGSCSRRLCQASQGPCSDTTLRCCCQPTYTNLQCQCGRSPPLLYEAVARLCICKPCEINVPFVGLLQSSSGVPVPLARIQVSGGFTISTDSYGMFGFIVRGTEEAVGISINVFPYAPVEVTFEIDPGIANVVIVPMIEMSSITIIPHANSLLTIKINQSSLSSSEMSVNASIGEVYITFPAGFFRLGEESLIQATMASMRDVGQDEVLVLRENFAMDGTDGAQFSGTRAKSIDVTQKHNEYPLWVAMYGKLVVWDEEGNALQLPSGINVSTHFDANEFLPEQLPQLRLFAFNSSRQQFQPISGSPMIEQLRNDEVLLQFNIGIVPSFLTFVIALPENGSCFALTRVFTGEPGAESIESEISRPVIYLTVGHKHFYRSKTRECTPIPCSGQLLVTIDDMVNRYIPSVIEYDLGRGRAEAGPVYHSLPACTARGMSSSNMDNFFHFNQVTRLSQYTPKSLHRVTDNFGNHCFVKVEILACPGNIMRVIATSDLPTTDIQFVEYTDFDDDTVVAGSAVACDQRHTACLYYVCDGGSIPINVTVSQCSQGSFPTCDTTFCHPKLNPPSTTTVPNQAPPLSPCFVFNSSEKGEGLYHSDLISAIAFYKCQISALTAMTFQCHVGYTDDMS